MADRVGGASGYFIYGRSWQTALIVAVMMSWGMMNLIAIGFERRTIINPSNQFKQFWFGDLFCLPVIVLILRYAAQHSGAATHWWRNPAWHIACLLIGLVIGVAFHRAEARVYPPRELNSPTKLYHDFVVFTLFIYVLASPVPAAVSGLIQKGAVTAVIMCIGIVVLSAVFLQLGVYDQKHPATNAHIPYSWRQLKPYWPNY